MDMKKIVVITSKFTNYKIDSKNENIKNEWIYNRMSIFMNFTAQSLMNQSNNEFIALYSYEDQIENDIEQALAKYPKLPDNIRFVNDSEYIKKLDEITEGYDILILSKLDSDNLYSDNFIETLMEYDLKDDTEKILFRNGYIYDVLSNRLAEYYHKKSAFYTFVYKLSNGEDKYLNLDITPMELLTGFSEFRAIDYKYEVLNERNFMVMIHKYSNNKTFSDYNNGFNKVERFIDKKQEIEKILYEFL